MAKKKITPEVPVEIKATKFYADCKVCDWKSECMTSPPSICGRCGANVVILPCGAVRE